MMVENVVRLTVLALGGVAVGEGTVVLASRARFYANHLLRDGKLAMWLLAVMNILVLSYIALVLLVDRWDKPLGWRVIVAGVIFVTKAVFFELLRRLHVEQKRRTLYEEACGMEGQAT